jgi:hypothetical protein
VKLYIHPSSRHCSALSARLDRRDKQLTQLHSRLFLVEKTGNKMEMARIQKQIKALSCSF